MCYLRNTTNSLFIWQPNVARASIRQNARVRLLSVIYVLCLFFPSKSRPFEQLKTQTNVLTRYARTIQRRISIKSFSANENVTH